MSYLKNVFFNKIIKNKAPKHQTIKKRKIMQDNQEQLTNTESSSNLNTKLNTNFSVKLLWATPDAERQVLYMARVSSKQRNSENTKLLNYLLREKHVSPFEMANMCVEITGPRAILRQILRHRSFSFQEFSLRYAAVDDTSLITTEARRQDVKNRQNSIPDMSSDIQQEWQSRQEKLNEAIYENYNWALQNGIAKECARAVLPEGNTLSTICMNGTLRSWIHFLQLRSSNGTQKEHQDIANACIDIFKLQFPAIYEAAFSTV